MAIYKLKTISSLSQEFSVNIENNTYLIRLKQQNNIVYMDLTVNGTVIFKGVRPKINTDIATTFRGSNLKILIMFLSNTARYIRTEDLGVLTDLYIITP